MSTSRWSLLMNRLHRSSEQLRDNTSRMLRMDAVNEPYRDPKALLRVHAQQDMRRLALGCDADIGGTSTAHLDFAPDPASADGSGAARFWGEMRLGVRSGLEGKIRSGYAGFRTKTRPTLFGEVTDDISNHEFLALRLRVRGHPRTRNSYYVNVQSASPASGELWQHRLYFQRDDGEWENVFIPFSAFALTSYGELASADSLVTLAGEHIRWVGISLLGGKSGVEGAFELGVDSITAVNQEHLAAPIRKDASADGPWQRGPLL